MSPGVLFNTKADIRSSAFYCRAKRESYTYLEDNS